MVDTPDFPDCNPVLFIDGKDKLWLFWIVVQANRWERSILKYRTAVDYTADGPPKWQWQDIITLKPGEHFVQSIKEAFDVLITEDVVWAEYALPYHEMVIIASQDPVKRQTGWMTRIHPLVLPSGRILLLSKRAGQWPWNCCGPALRRRNALQTSPESLALRSLDSASVTIVDNYSAPIITFENVQIIGESEFCQNSGFDSDFSAMPGADFYAD